MLGLTADNLGTILVAAALAITALIGRQQGKKIVASSKPSSGMVEVSAGIISDKAALELLRAAKMVALALDDHGEKLDENTKACLEAAKRAEIASTAIRDLAKEIEISSRLNDRSGRKI